MQCELLIDYRSMRYVSLLLMVVGLSAATPEDEIKMADQAWAKAVKTRDVATLEKMYTNDLVYGHSTGNVDSKQKYLDRLKTGKQRYDTMTFESTKVLLYGDSAITHSFVRFTGVNDAGPFNDHLMLMHYWVKQNGAWRIAAHQTAKIK